MVMYSRDTMDKVNGGRGRNAAWGVEPSGGGWRLVGVGEVKVDFVPSQERRREASVQRVR